LNKYNLTPNFVRQFSFYPFWIIVPQGTTLEPDKNAGPEYLEEEFCDKLEK